jgi:hypothetical protein
MEVESSAAPLAGGVGSPASSAPPARAGVSFAPTPEGVGSAARGEGGNSSLGAARRAPRAKPSLA